MPGGAGGVKGGVWRLFSNVRNVPTDATDGIEIPPGRNGLVRKNRCPTSRASVNFAAMRIAVISDTHDRYPPSLPRRLRGADEIWHLGDVCAPEVLVEFEQLGPPLRVVRGNCDANEAWPLALELEREGVKFFLTHIPPERAPDFADTASGGSAIARVVLHGHTHVARDEMIDGVRWLNPGAISRPREGGASFAWLTVERGKLTSWAIVKV